MFKKFISMSFAVIMCFILCSCGSTDNSVKTTTKWQMSDEAQTYYNNYETGNYDDYFKPCATFNGWLNSLLDRSDDPQVLPTMATPLTHTPTCTQYKNENVYIMSNEGYDKIVLYLHGGAYVAEVDKMHVSFCDSLVDKINAKVYLPLYPLAPQHTWQDAYDMLDELYADLLEENKPIYIMGDSAGGGLTLAFTEHIIAKNLTAPNKIVMISPWLDISTSNADIANYEEKDTTLSAYGAQICGKLWAGTTDIADYHLSPINGNLSDLPDMLIFLSDSEIMYPDVMKLYNSVKNTNVQLIVGEGYFHVFPIYPIPEKQQALNLIKDFCK